MAYEDWYNIVTELNYMASLGQPIEFAGERLDGSLEGAARLIQRGAESLTTVDTGELMVNLGGIGLDLKSGGEALQNGVTAGMKEVAHGQIEMLDGMIRLLETIVAMEKLSNIDTNTNGQIDLTDMFEVTTGLNSENIYIFKREFKDRIQEILNIAENGNEELNQALDEMTISWNEQTITMRQFF